MPQLKVTFLGENDLFQKIGRNQENNARLRQEMTWAKMFNKQIVHRFVLKSF